MTRNRLSLSLPVLLVLVAIAQEARAFSQNSEMIRQRTRRTQLSQPHHNSNGLKTCMDASTTPFWATVEHTAVPSFTKTATHQEHDAVEERINSDSTTKRHIEVIVAASEATHHHKAVVSATAQQWQRRRKSKRNSKKSNHNKSRLNPAMGDPAFLRKRTEKLLALDTTTTFGGDSQSHNRNTISSRGMKVNRNTFHFLIDAWAFSGELDATTQAMALLKKMEQLSFTGGGMASVIPDVRSYTKVMNAMARSATPRAGEMAHEILDKMNYLYQSGENVAVHPNTFTYTAVVEAYANSGDAHNAERICERMVELYLLDDDQDVRPTSRAFNAVINAYAKRGDAERADDVFRRMESVYLTTGLEQVKPNAYNYNSLISAWANCGQEGAAQRAEQVLERMEAAYKGGDDDDDSNLKMTMKPTTVTYNAVIDAYSKVRTHQDPQHQQQHHQQDEYQWDDDMPQQQYSAEQVGEKAENILRHMEALYNSGENVDAKPNVRSYNTVINVWAKSQSDIGAKRAEEILDLMERMFKGGDSSVAPDVHSFSTVINAWARSQKEHKADRALNLLKEMKQLYRQGNENLKPNVVVANAVMNACAYTMGEVPERNRALEIAHKVLKDLELGEYGNPDQVTYGTFLKVCANQMPECSTRDQIVDMVFQKCSRDGQVGDLVLQQLKTIVTPQKYFSLVGIDMYDEHQMEDLPREWWCNVVEGKWRRRRNFEGPQL
ncbi:Pentatricopeptide repeat-containing protein [Seminavis robusta]|uniref:Pentatricopeptide repeat-containing protein n=1 Tax=Seminavis robusta TaxID=568900 RepID=A0A9N8EDX5_9STRA|nr:Pentatricopeptide repeat-containing protein [Seminavis robusta]|eukprot:Sro1011_g230990.1 Pentatricopeptide repeat-containing protein (721) ;mRNA; r:5310-7701